jgi:hypothetical protein
MLIFRKMEVGFAQKNLRVTVPVHLERKKFDKEFPRIRKEFFSQPYLVFKNPSTTSKESKASRFKAKSLFFTFFREKSGKIAKNREKPLSRKVSQK